MIDIPSMSEEMGQSLPSKAQIGKYKIKRVLGAGGFGVTYLADDLDLGREVVIKENLPRFFAYRDNANTVRPKSVTTEDAENFEWSMNSFMREAETVAKFDHPAIVKVFDRFQANGTAYFVMPFVEGASLGELVKNGKRFYEEEILSILTSLLGAFTAIHKHQIFHRDVKPDNILITEKGPILIDFGAARERVSEKNLTVIESVGYTPFEQMQTKGNVGPWSDLYGLAAAFYKLLTGEAPPKANDRVRNDPLIPLAQRPELKKRYSTNLLHTLDQCLLFDEYDRPQSAATVQEMLQGGVVTQTATTTATSFTSNTSPQPIQQQEKSKTPLILGTIGGVCILGLLAFIAYLLVGKEPSAPVVVGNNSNPTSAPQEKQNNTQSELERIQAETEAAKLAKARAERDKAIAAKEKADAEAEDQFIRNAQARAERDRITAQERTKETAIQNFVDNYMASLSQSGVAYSQLFTNSVDYQHKKNGKASQRDMKNAYDKFEKSWPYRNYYQDGEVTHRINGIYATINIPYRYDYSNYNGKKAKGYATDDLNLYYDGRKWRITKWRQSVRIERLDK